MRKQLVIAAVAFLGAGCAGIRPMPAAEKKVVASFNDQGMTSEQIAIRRDGTSLQGKVLSRDVALAWEGTEVKGRYHKLPVALAVLPEGDATRVEGEFDGTASAFKYSAQKLEGYLGPCAFLLERVGESEGSGVYRGQRLCVGSKAETLVVTPPAALAQRSETERAAWMTLLLADHTAQAPLGSEGIIMSAEFLRDGARGCRR